MIDIPNFFRLDGQVAVITGGASGIGQSTAEVLAAAGAAVVIGDIDEEGAAKTAEGITAEGGSAISRRTDTSKRADVDALVEAAVSPHGRLDILCNVAGIGYAKPVAEITDEDFERVMGINLKGVLFGCQAALKVMVPNRSGNIVNVASTVVDTPYPTQSLYGMSKVGVTFLTKVLAAEVGTLGIRVNALAPGSTPTNFASFRYPEGKVDPDREAAFQDVMKETTPLGFLGEALDQALMTLFLVSPAGRWTTGNVWRVNGGQTRI
jgi:3-oxoacyl-[acyl-carrier protein] reductase